MFLAGAGAGAWVVLTALHAIEHAASELHMLAVLLALPAALWLQVTIHEAGHALAALARGYHLLAFGAGPLRFERALSGWRFDVTGNVRGISGFALALPTLHRRPTRWDNAIFFLGGPLANLLTAGIALAVLPMAEPASATDVGLRAIATFGFFLGAVNLVPFQNAGWRTDGQMLLELWRRPALAECYLCLQHIAALSMTGVRPRDWPEGMIPSVPEPGVDTHLRIGAAALRLSRALDLQQNEAAHESARILAQE